MGVRDFDTKVAVVVSDDLAAWQRLNVCAFLMSGVVAGAGRDVVGPEYVDRSARRYLPMLVQPVLVFEASAGKLRTVYERAVRAGSASRSTPRTCSRPARTKTTEPPWPPWRATNSTWWASRSGPHIGQQTPWSEG